MSAIEVTAEHPVPVPTPVRATVPKEGLPAGESVRLVEPGGHATAAQRDGAASIVFLVSGLEAGERRRYTVAPADGSEARVEVKPGEGRQLDITVAGKSLTSYQYDAELPRPFCFPVVGPAERLVTRNFPMKPEIAGETKDHPHHRSLWTAYGEVNGVDCWSDGAGHGWIRHQGFHGQSSGPVFGGFTADNSWTTADGKPVLGEQRALRFYNPGQEQRLLDYDLTLIATEGDVEFGDTKEGGLIAFRVATSMDGNKGGRIENSSGGVGERECWGKSAAWCDYSGPVGGKVVGIAVMDHPGNFRHPTHWHVRDYGLFATNVFGTSSFEGGDGMRGRYTLKKGERLVFRYRVLIHPGDAAAGKVSDAYHGYIQPPAATFIP